MFRLDPAILITLHSHAAASPVSRHGRAIERAAGYREKRKSNDKKPSGPKSCRVTPIFPTTSMRNGTYS